MIFMKDAANSGAHYRCDFNTVTSFILLQFLCLSQAEVSSDCFWHAPYYSKLSLNNLPSSLQNICGYFKACY